MPLVPLQQNAILINPGGLPKRLTANGGTVYLGNDATTSSTNNTGSIAAATSQDITRETWVFGPGLTLEVDDIPGQIEEQATGVVGQTIQPAGEVLLGNRFQPNDANEAFTVSGDGSIRWGAGGASALDTLLQRSGAGLLALLTASLRIATVGQGLRVAEGANAKQGLSAAMVAGTVTVPNTSITASSRIQLTRQDGGTNPGAVYVSARTPGTSFVITSTSATDTGTVAYEIFEPA